MHGRAKIDQSMVVRCVGIPIIQRVMACRNSHAATLVVRSAATSASSDTCASHNPDFNLSIEEEHRISITDTSPTFVCGCISVWVQMHVKTKSNSSHMLDLASLATI